MTTVRETIEGSLRLIGQLAEEESMNAATAQDALSAFNQMIDSWSIERLAVYTTTEQVFTWPPGFLLRTLGPTGDFVGLRPVQIDGSTYFVDLSMNVTPGLTIINQDQYNGIAVKTVTSTYPNVLWPNMEFPNVELRVYPVPTKPLEWHFVSVKPLAQPANLSDNLLFPPGYLRAFRYNLATEFCSEFGVEPSPQTARVAMTSKRNLKRINDPMDLMSMPRALVMRQGRYNIYTG